MLLSSNHQKQSFFFYSYSSFSSIILFSNIPYFHFSSGLTNCSTIRKVNLLKDRSSCSIGSMLMLLIFLVWLSCLLCFYFYFLTKFCFLAGDFFFFLFVERCDGRFGNNVGIDSTFELGYPLSVFTIVSSSKSFIKPIYTLISKM